MNKKWGLILYSLGHLLVDGACCLVVLSSTSGSDENTLNLALAIILYNTIAFGLQPFFGLLADKIGHTNFIACCGCILVGSSAAFMHAPFAAAVAAGLGNAMFHIGGGVYSLNIDRQRAAYAGVFVAPGTIGLFLGGLASQTLLFKPWFVIVPMALTAIAVLPIPHLPCNIPTAAPKQNKNLTLLPLLLLLLVIVLRSVVGSVGVYPWKSTNAIGLLMVMTIALGKAAGGVLSDWAGRRNTTVIALLLSAPLLAFCESGIVLSLAGLFLFNLTMAVTVTEIADHLQGYSGFAFGLTTLALIIGTYFIYFGWKEFFANQWITFICIILSVILMFFSIPQKEYVLTDGQSHEKKSIYRGGQNHEEESVHKGSQSHEEESVQTTM
ncbi:MAG: MFS transporter [Ruminiclostridium sp.]|nr:MFS transporter [Ruminiclostridium sp.]